MHCMRIVKLTIVAAGCASLAYAQSDYPNRPIRIVVPVAPGGNVDIVARTLAAELSKSMGQTVLVENRPSAASLVGNTSGRQGSAGRLHAPRAFKHFFHRTGDIGERGL